MSPSNAGRSAWVERYKAAILERWRALFDAHGVKYGNAEELLWRMAEAHVPGLREQRQSGPRTVWGEVEKAELRIAVDEYVAEREREGKPASIVQACGVLAKRDPWKAMLRTTATKPAVALRGHYNTADHRWVQMVRDARALDALIKREISLAGMANFARNSEQSKSRRKKSS